MDDNEKNKKEVNTPKKESKSSDINQNSAKPKKSKLKTVKQLDNLFDKINQAELEKAAEKWLKSKDLENNITKRDFTLLSTHIAEYLESYVLFGYDLHGQRMLVYSIKSSKDSDAIIEYLKKIFIRQQSTDFLGDNSEPYDESDLDEPDKPL